ncbi:MULTISPECIES: hypothetical protein [Cupriavidus]|uniref:hypothetical protein n=1 Tax=Cupriavidus TaxID=106589 RepID=UPI001266E8E6|nr:MULTISPECIES: hypothetical protein [Cupriavidus]
MNNLKLDFYPMTNVSPLSFGFSESARIGRIVLAVIGNSIDRILVDVKWDFGELVSWFAENRTSIKMESLPDFVSWDCSIAKSIDKIYESPDNYSDEQLDMLFEYRRRHEICFGMRGVKIPSLYVGVGSLGEEVSGEVDRVRFRYPVNLDSFFRELEALS